MLLHRIASIMAFMIGGMSILAGGMVLRGRRPGWNVIGWLPVYNFVVGWLTLIPAGLIWVNHPYAFAAAIATFSVHAAVLLLLLTAFRHTAAFQSVGAMSFRVTAWVVILALLYFRRVM